MRNINRQWSGECLTNVLVKPSVHKQLQQQSPEQSKYQDAADIEPVTAAVKLLYQRERQREDGRSRGLPTRRLRQGDDRVEVKRHR